MTDLAIYDLDRTLTRRATYTPFLIHCALRRAPWRLLLTPAVLASMLLYGVRIIDRGRLKEINHRLLLGRWIHPKDLKPLVDSFADATVAHNIRPGASQAIARDRHEGRRLVLATASYRLYADAIAERLGFADVIGTGSMIGLDERIRSRIEGDNAYGEAKLRMIAEWVENRETADMLRDFGVALGQGYYFGKDLEDALPLEGLDGRQWWQCALPYGCLSTVTGHPERNLLLVKGAVPGPRGGIVLVRAAAKGA